MINNQVSLGLLLKLVAIVIGLASLFFSYPKGDVRLNRQLPARQRVLDQLYEDNKWMKKFKDDVLHSNWLSAHLPGIAFGLVIYILIFYETINNHLNTVLVSIVVFFTSAMTTSYLSLPIKEKIVKHLRDQKYKFFYHNLKTIYFFSIFWFTIILLRGLWDVLLYLFFRTNTLLENMEVSLSVMAVAFLIAAIIRLMNGYSIAELDQDLFEEFRHKSSVTIPIKVFIGSGGTEQGTDLIEGYLTGIGRELGVIDSSGYNYRIDWTRVHVIGTK